MEPELEKKLAAREAQLQEKARAEAGGVMGIGSQNLCQAPSTQAHPTELVMAQIEEAEEVLFQRLTKIKELKRGAKHLGRHDAQLVLDLIELFRPRY